MAERNNQRTLWFTDRGQIVELVPFSSLYKGGNYPNWDGNESTGKPKNGFKQQLASNNEHSNDSSPEALAPSNLPCGIPDFT